MDYKDYLPLEVKPRRNAKEDMARIVNLNYEILVQAKRTNELLMDLIGVPPIPKSTKLPTVPKILKGK